MPDKKDCSFFLKEPKATTPTLIYFHMTCPDDTVKRSIKEKVLPASWDFKDQRASGSDRGARDINQIIDAIIAVIPGVKSDCRRNNKILHSSDIHAALDVILQDKRPNAKPKAKETKGMILDFKKVINGMKDGSITTPKKKKRYAESTIRNYEKVILPKIEAYFTEKKKPAVWSAVTIDLYNSFVSWCHTKEHSNNSIGAYVMHWKVVGKIALNKGMHSNAIFKDEKFMALKEETPAIYLDDIKIEKIYKHHFTEPHLTIARDWAILDCYLGLRVSDLRKVIAEDFKGEMFQFVNQKTGAYIAIPINRYAKEILKKWDGLPPAMIPNTFRRNLKTVAKKAKLSDKFVYVATIAGRVQKIEYEEWECVSPHTLRRSFITNLLKLGVPHAQVMRLAGIKSYDTLMRYFKQTPIEVANEMKDHPFFK
jgi:integrase